MLIRTIDLITKKSTLQWFFVILLGFFLGLYILFIVRFPSKWIPYFLLAGIFPFIVLVIGHLRKILLALILLDIPLKLDIALGSSWLLNNTGAINGYNVSITSICLAALYVLWLLDYLVKQETVLQKIRHPNRFLTLYLAIAGISMFFGYYQMIASFEIFLLVQIFLLYFYVINKVRTGEDLLFILVMLLVGFIAESLIIMLMQVVGQGFSFAGFMGNIYADANTPGGISRIGGTLISANSAGSYLGMLLVPAFSIMLTKLQRPYKWLALLAFICGAFALILTGSRGAWMGTFVSFIIFVIVSFRRGWLQLRIVTISVAIGIIISLAFYAPIYQRITGDDAGAAAGRVPQFQVALQIIKDHPIFGVGANNYPVIQRRYVGQDPDTKVFLWAVHNKYLLVWAENGFLGLLFFVLFLFSTLRLGFKITRNKGNFLSLLALGFSTAIMGQMVHMFFDVFHGRSEVQLLWLVAALLMVMNYLQLPAENRDSAMMDLTEKDRLSKSTLFAEVSLAGRYG